MQKTLSLFSFLFAACCTVQLYAGTPVQISSPGAQTRLSVDQSPSGTISYQVSFKNRPAVLPSTLGLQLKEPAVSLNSFDIIKIDSGLVDENWKPVWGEYGQIRNHAKTLSLQLVSRNEQKIRINLLFRIYEEGIAFRYQFPEQPGLQHFILGDELSTFGMSGDHKAFWIPGDYDTNEYPYNESKLSAIDATVGQRSTEIAVRSIIAPNAVQTPLMMKSSDGLYINIHEASLRNYPAMNLMLDKKSMQFKSVLVPDAVGNKAYLQAPAQSPWRSIIIADNGADILRSSMILNLNDAPAAGLDFSFVKPQKIVGVWWEMHVGKASWDYSGGQVGSQQQSRVPHGANNQNVRRYIDFASKYGFDGVLVEGWNTGWEDWFGKWKEDVFDFLTPYPDYDLNALSAYARQKNVRLIMHHETSGSVTNYERYMDRAYDLMNRHQMNTVKTGYVGRIIPRGERHDGQGRVRHYERVAEATAKKGIMIDVHEPVRPTGLHRSFPNWLASEAARGNEFNAWSVGNAPDHETILPFTRLMGGPMDYTPGIFKIKMSHYNPAKTEQVHTTLCKQLALYITMYSPLQMAADLPENYEARPDAFQFIRDVAVDWDDTKILDAEPGDYVYIARREKGGRRWFAGGITDEQARNFILNTRFLEPGQQYLATIYRDAPGAHWKDNPEAYVIEKFIVNNRSALNLKLAAGGGFAISMVPATGDDLKQYKAYKQK